MWRVTVCESFSPSACFTVNDLKWAYDMCFSSWITSLLLILTSGCTRRQEDSLLSLSFSFIRLFFSHKSQKGRDKKGDLMMWMNDENDDDEDANINSNCWVAIIFVAWVTCNHTAGCFAGCSSHLFCNPFHVWSVPISSFWTHQIIFFMPNKFMSCVIEILFQIPSPLLSLVLAENCSQTLFMQSKDMMWWSDPWCIDESVMIRAANVSVSVPVSFPVTKNGRNISSSFLLISSQNESNSWQEDRMKGWGDVFAFEMSVRFSSHLRVWLLRKADACFKSCSCHAIHSMCMCVCLS